MSVSNDLFSKIVSFTSKETSCYKIEMKRETKLRSDIGIDGTDGVEFIYNFGKHFNVDVTNLKLDDYFVWEGNQFLSAIFKLKNESLKDISIGDLENAVKIGRLDSAILGGDF